MARTIVITGANRGIGLAVVEALAQRKDAHELCIVMLCRRAAEAELARRALAHTTRAELVLVEGALDSTQSIHTTADRLEQACASIDILIHNAGVWPGHLVRNDDGLEQAFVVNHLAPFLLNRRLEAKLADRAARIVQVSAGIYLKGQVDIERTPRGADFSPLTTYANTKLCNLLLLSHFAERLRPLGVSINALHPGVIRTGLGDRNDLLGAVIKLLKRVLPGPERAAPPIVRLALDPALAGATGRYYHVNDEQALLPKARDLQLADALWQQAEQLTGLTSIASRYDGSSTAR